MLSLGLTVFGPGEARAGMPMASFSDIAAMRLEAISFFALVFLLSASAVWRIWNSLRKDFPRLPHLRFRAAIGLVTIWGLAFLLVLTMISGARELMTPGAWKKQGLTYQLAGDTTEVEKAAAAARDAERRHAIDRLRLALWTYARHHDGRFPATSTPVEIPDETWIVPDPAAMRYLYQPGLTADRGRSPLVYEPGVFGDERFVVLTSGEITRMSDEVLRAELAERSSK